MQPRIPNSDGERVGGREGGDVVLYNTTVPANEGSHELQENGGGVCERVEACLIEEIQVRDRSGPRIWQRSVCDAVSRERVRVRAKDERKLEGAGARRADERARVSRDKDRGDRV